MWDHIPPPPGFLVTAAWYLPPFTRKVLPSLNCDGFSCFHASAQTVTFAQNSFLPRLRGEHSFRPQCLVNSLPSLPAQLSIPAPGASWDLSFDSWGWGLGRNAPLQRLGQERSVHGVLPRCFRHTLFFNFLFVFKRTIYPTSFA